MANLLAINRTSGPGGIRTRDLISAIDARSQLRYRPREGFDSADARSTRSATKQPPSLLKPRDCTVARRGCQLRGLCRL